MLGFIYHRFLPSTGSQTSEVFFSPEISKYLRFSFVFFFRRISGDPASVESKPLDHPSSLPSFQIDRLFPLLEELDALIISEQGNDFIADIDDSFKLQLTTKLEHQSSISSCLDESHGSKLLGSLYLFLLKCFPVKLSSNFRLSSRISLAQLLSAELCKRLQVSSINLYYFSRCL